MKQTKREMWSERVRRWRSSGLDVAAFAASEGCSAKTLQWWSWQLGSRRKKHRKEIVSTPTLVEVVPQIIHEASTSELPFEVSLPGGARVVVPARFEPHALQALLGALGRR